ncbi:DegT/DnrJ/EryC1/StrS family aminotransferase [Larkinella terrae]|uniref:Aminotransferase class I/II-fold pyridoxal phosphate-dependent enzyme n=1 Tax=Larkinella terrae TaxID=2025311 RepID=A0A7K0ELS7_9BACT|nr:DegT/DnrJ/EryC1/StrS family aminotransferase [Larkinella terrae]MRS62744.1 aminotransferase class I/II-fold pyridoxal phosphate-dependent enzyme [Larkinella terrae]
MSHTNFSRREFLRRNSLTGLGAVLSPSLLANGKSLLTPETIPQSIKAPSISIAEAPALLGGKPVRAKAWPTWPLWKPETDEKQLLEVIRSGIWSRANVVNEFEAKWAAALGVKRALTVVNGTNAIMAALAQFDIRGGDEVLVPPYTFIGTVAPILMVGAMPVFVDVDPETFQIDPAKIEAKITPRTRAIIPVHILGLPANMTQILPIAKKHNLVVIEDACQAHFAEINHRKVGTLGNAGCFSFQNSKNLAIGEGGAIVSNDDVFMDRCFSYQNYGNPYGLVSGVIGAGTLIQGTKLRLTEYQAAIGLAQLQRLDAQTTLRNENAAYLKSKIKDIPGIVPYKLYDDVTRAAFHLFPFRFKKENFKGLSRDVFVKALTAEGIPCSKGYATLNTMPYLNDTFQTKNYQKMYPKSMLDFNSYIERNRCPQNDRLCNEEAVWLTQNMLLGTRTDMDEIASAIEKVYAHADKLLTQK